jgi:hypothetical protein
MKSWTQGSATQSWAQSGAGDEDVDLIKAVIKEGVHPEDDLVKTTRSEAPHRVCHVREHVLAVLTTPSMRRTGPLETSSVAGDTRRGSLQDGC